MRFLPPTEKYSRIVTAPDGMSYLITMEGWYWNALEWGHSEKGWEEKVIIKGAWNAAKQTEKDGTMNNPGNFPAEFAQAFEYYIWINTTDLLNKEDGIINDNLGWF